MEKRHKINRRLRARSGFSVCLSRKVWGDDEQRKASFQCWARIKHVSIQYQNHRSVSSADDSWTSYCWSKAGRVTCQARFITCDDDFPKLRNLNDELKSVLRRLQSFWKQKQSILARWWWLQPGGVDSYPSSRNPPARALASYLYAAADWVS